MWFPSKRHRRCTRCCCCIQHNLLKVFHAKCINFYSIHEHHWGWSRAQLVVCTTPFFVDCCVKSEVRCCDFNYSVKLTADSHKFVDYKDNKLSVRFLWWYMIARYLFNIISAFTTTAKECWEVTWFVVMGYNFQGYAAWRRGKGSSHLRVLIQY